MSTELIEAARELTDGLVELDRRLSALSLCLPEPGADEPLEERWDDLCITWQAVAVMQRNLQTLLKAQEVPVGR